MRTKDVLALLIAILFPIAVAVFVFSPAAIQAAVELSLRTQGWPTLLVIGAGAVASIWLGLRAGARRTEGESEMDPS